MSTTHTRGPWALHQTIPGGSIYVIGPEPASAYLASIQVDDVRSETEALANGALMAAAPDLLEACESALACILKHVPATTFAPRDMLRAAIARAKGEHSSLDAFARAAVSRITRGD